MARAYGKWVIENPITVERFKRDLADGSIGIEAVLASTGAYIQEEMIKITDKTKASGRLSDSITWQTVKRGTNIRSGAEADDKIEKPKTANTLLVGSAAPHAIYREKGSGMHKYFEGHEKFEELMKEWCRTKFNKPFNPDSGDPKDKALFLHILQVVREGHEAVPFVEPNLQKVLPYAIKRFKIALTKYFKAGKK